MNRAAQLPRLARAGDVLLTAVVAGDPPVAALLRQRGLQGEILPPEAGGPALGPVHRFSPGGATG